MYNLIYQETLFSTYAVNMPWSPCDAKTQLPSKLSERGPRTAPSPLKNGSQIATDVTQKTLSARLADVVQERFAHPVPISVTRQLSGRAINVPKGSIRNLLLQSHGDNTDTTSVSDCSLRTQPPLKRGTPECLSPVGLENSIQEWVNGVDDDAMLKYSKTPSWVTSFKKKSLDGTTTPTTPPPSCLHDLDDELPERRTTGKSPTRQLFETANTLVKSDTDLLYSRSVDGNCWLNSTSEPSWLGSLESNRRIVNSNNRTHREVSSQRLVLSNETGVPQPNSEPSSTGEPLRGAVLNNFNQQFSNPEKEVSVCYPTVDQQTAPSGIGDNANWSSATTDLRAKSEWNLSHKASTYLREGSLDDNNSISEKSHSTACAAEFGTSEWKSDINNTNLGIVDHNNGTDWSSKISSHELVTKLEQRNANSETDDYYQGNADPSLLPGSTTSASAFVVEKFPASNGAETNLLKPVRRHYNENSLSREIGAARRIPSSLSPKPDPCESDYNVNLNKSSSELRSQDDCQVEVVPLDECRGNQMSECQTNEGHSSVVSSKRESHRDYRMIEIEPLNETNDKHLEDGNQPNHADDQLMETNQNNNNILENIKDTYEDKFDYKVSEVNNNWIQKPDQSDKSETLNNLDTVTVGVEQEPRKALSESRSRSFVVASSAPISAPVEYKFASNVPQCGGIIKIHVRHTLTLRKKKKIKIIVREKKASRSNYSQVTTQTTEVTSQSIGSQTGKDMKVAGFSKEIRKLREHICTLEKDSISPLSHNIALQCSLGPELSCVGVQTQCDDKEVIKSLEHQLSTSITDVLMLEERLHRFEVDKTDSGTDAYPDVATAVRVSCLERELHDNQKSTSLIRDQLVDAEIALQDAIMKIEIQPPKTLSSKSVYSQTNSIVTSIKSVALQCNPTLRNTASGGTNSAHIQFRSIGTDAVDDSSRRGKVENSNQMTHCQRLLGIRNRLFSATIENPDSSHSSHDSVANLNRKDGLRTGSEDIFVRRNYYGDISTPRVPQANEVVAGDTFYGSRRNSGSPSNAAELISLQSWTEECTSSLSCSDSSHDYRRQSRTPSILYSDYISKTNNVLSEADYDHNLNNLLQYPTPLNVKDSIHISRRQPALRSCYHPEESLVARRSHQLNERCRHNTLLRENSCNAGVMTCSGSEVPSEGIFSVSSAVYDVSDIKTNQSNGSGDRCLKTPSLWCNQPGESSKTLKETHSVLSLLPKRVLLSTAETQTACQLAAGVVPSFKGVGFTPGNSNKKHLYSTTSVMVVKKAVPVLHELLSSWTSVTPKVTLSASIGSSTLRRPVCCDSSTATIAVAPMRHQSTSTEPPKYSTLSNSTEVMVILKPVLKSISIGNDDSYLTVDSCSQVDVCYNTVQVQATPVCYDAGVNVKPIGISEGVETADMSSYLRESKYLVDACQGSEPILRTSVGVGEFVEVVSTGTSIEGDHMISTPTRESISIQCSSSSSDVATQSDSLPSTLPTSIILDCMQSVVSHIGARVPNTGVNSPDLNTVMEKLEGLNR